MTTKKVQIVVLIDGLGRSDQFDQLRKPDNPPHGSLTAGYREAIAKVLHEHGPLRQAEICRAANVPTGSITYSLKHWRFEKLEDGRYRLAEGAEPRVIPEAKPIERAPEMEPVPKKDTPMSTSDYKAAVIQVLKKYKQLYEYDIARLARVPNGTLRYVLCDEKVFLEVTAAKWELTKEFKATQEFKASKAAK